MRLLYKDALRAADGHHRSSISSRPLASRFDLLDDLTLPLHGQSLGYMLRETVARTPAIPGIKNIRLKFLWVWLR